MNDVNLYEEIFTVANHLYERNGSIESRYHDNWIEAERIVMTLRKIAGDDGRRYILVNIPETRYVLKKQNENEVVKSCKKVAHKV
jgi:hypothetical protein